MLFMEEIFIGGKGPIREGRKSVSLREVSQKVEQLSQRRKVSLIDPITSLRTTHEAISSTSFNKLLKNLPNLARRKCNIGTERILH